MSTSRTNPPSTALPLVAAVLVCIGSVVYAASAGRFMWSCELAGVLVIGGIAVWCSYLVVGEIRSVNRPADDAFTEGYEAGYDRGWRDRDAETRPNLLLLPTASPSAENADSCGAVSQIPAGRASN